MSYSLYLESGPQRKTTYVHVLEPFGCTWMAATSEAAVERAPGEIRAYLRFLQRAGEAVDLGGEPVVEVAEHRILRGAFLSNADFPVDFAPCSRANATVGLRRFVALTGETLALVAGLPRPDLDAIPPKGRAISAILAHILGSAQAYASPLGLPGVHAIAKAAETNALDPREALARAAAIIAPRLETLTEDELRSVRQSGATVRSASRMFRRLLEHGWEHYREIEARQTRLPPVATRTAGRRSTEFTAG